MTLFTIGYEGRNIEEYLDLLKRNMVTLVIDVRRNPVSRKRGFSKNRMREALSSEGIEYMHFPQLGIESKKRKGLKSKSDYLELFSWYENEVLPNEHDALTEIISILNKYERVALTCYESDYTYCHRSSVSSKLTEIADQEPDLVHL
ncbi:MAG: DUF488 family protein [Candidatus Aegiribacteria sp.]|nr:DUF488 family protein [Candidatus Aegiribacteria sp.]